MARIQQLLIAGVAGGMVLLILGLRWTLIDRYAIDLPTWDEWDAQGLHTLVPWFQHQPMLAELFTPHNEHRVVLTKLLNLAVTLLNGQWDQRLECVINAFFPAGLALALLCWGARFLGSVMSPILVAVLIAAWGLPFAWHNTIAGFHSQQFFVIGLSCVALAWLPFTPTGTWRWWLGSLASALALLSMASGSFAAAIILLVVAIQLSRRSLRFRQVWPTLVVAACVVLLGILMRHEVAYHATLKAANAADFFGTLSRFLAWPAVPLCLGAIIWLPWLVVAWSVLRRKRTADRSLMDAWLLFALGAWVILNVVATAFARGAGGPAPSTRYLDTLVLGNVVNFLSLGWLLRQRARNDKSDALRGSPAFGPKTNRRTIRLGAFTSVWLAVVGVGLYHESKSALHGDLLAMRDSQRQAVARTRAYLDSGNLAYLESKDIPYPGPDSFVDRLNRPELAPLLPASVRPAVTVIPTPKLHGFDRSMSLAPLPWDETASTGLMLALSTPARSPDAPLHRAMWRSTSQDHELAYGEWTLHSLPRSGQLVFALVGSTGSAIEFRSAATDELLAEAHPTNEREWSMATVAVPAGPIVLRARTTSPAERLGFTEPVFMPSLSYVAWRTAASGKLIQKIGAMLLLFCLVALGVLHVRSRSTHDVARS
ncbi:MAG: hypothetical protein ABIZ04_05765 [Opitutus sp.]